MRRQDHQYCLFISSGCATANPGSERIRIAQIVPPEQLLRTSCAANLQANPIETTRTCACNLWPCRRNSRARRNVITFTASDFGRTFTSNGDGTDHGWGSHHLVMGGALYGGDLYGRFPVLGLKNANNNNFDSSDDQLTNGAMLPAASVDQLGATLGRWFGLSDVQIADIFPNLANWDLAKRDLGFFTPPA